MRYIILLLMFIFLIQVTACKKVIYIVEDSYNSNDEIYVCDFLLAEAFEYRTYRFIYRKQDKYFSDSVFSILKKQLQDLPININFNSENSNLVDSRFLDNKYDMPRLPPEDFIIKIAKKCDNKTVLVPFVFFRHFRNSVPGGEWYSTRLNIVLYIVKEAEISFAYFKSWKAEKRIFAITNDTERRFDLHTDEEWQEMIGAIMEPYIERIKQ